MFSMLKYLKCGNWIYWILLINHGLQLLLVHLCFQIWGENVFSFQRRTHFDVYGELKNWKNMFLSRNSDLVTETKHGMENKIFFCHS